MAKRETGPAERRARALAAVRDELRGLAGDVEARYGAAAGAEPDEKAAEADARALADLAAELRSLRAGPGLAA